MTLILILHGYPPAIIRKTDRLAYLSALETAQLGGSKEPYFKLIFAAVDRSLSLYLNALKGKGESAPEPSEGLLKIGELAKHTNQTVSTIRYWTHEGLLQMASTLPSGYALYSEDMIKQCTAIANLKKKGLSLKQIRKKLEA
jgi:hypothetical protein